MDFLYCKFIHDQIYFLSRFEVTFPIQDISCVCCGARIPLRRRKANVARPVPIPPGQIPVPVPPGQIPVPIPPGQIPVFPPENFLPDEGFDHFSNYMEVDPPSFDNPGVQDDDGFFEEEYKHIEVNEGEYTLPPDEWTMKWTVEQALKKYHISSQAIQTSMFAVWLVSPNRPTIIFETVLLMKMISRQLLDRIKAARFELARQNKLSIANLCSTEDAVCHLLGGGKGRGGGRRLWYE